MEYSEFFWVYALYSEKSLLRGYSFRIWNILDIFRQTKQNIFIPLVKVKVSNDEEQHDGKKS